MTVALKSRCSTEQRTSRPCRDDLIVLHYGHSRAVIADAVVNGTPLTAPCGATRIPFQPPFPTGAVVCLACTLASRGVTHEG